MPFPEVRGDPVGNMTRILLSASLLMASFTVCAQGQDSTPAERYLRVMVEMLPGIYDNANQNYFDRRRELSEADQHARVHVRIKALALPQFGEQVFLWKQNRTTAGEEQVSYRLVTLTSDGPDDAVVMRQYFDREQRLAEAVASMQWDALYPAKLTSTKGCEYYFRRRAAGFRGQQKSQQCRFEWQGQAVYTDNTIEWSAEDLFMHDHKFRADTGERITGVASGEPYWLERAREFSCFVDIPGVGGGRDEAFERYDNITLHDKGGSHWLTTRDESPQEIGIALQSVSWHVLNEDSGNFNRDSLVVYVMERLQDGTVKEHGYGFTEPDAERIGINLKWMLVNCALVPPSAARPEL